jgi:hypothetical protein
VSGEERTSRLHTMPSDASQIFDIEHTGKLHYLDVVTPLLLQ